MQRFLDADAATSGLLARIEPGMGLVDLGLEAPPG